MSNELLIEVLESLIGTIAIGRRKVKSWDVQKPGNQYRITIKLGKLRAVNTKLKEGK